MGGGQDMLKQDIEASHSRGDVWIIRWIGPQLARASSRSFNQCFFLQSLALSANSFSNSQSEQTSLLKDVHVFSALPIIPLERRCRGANQLPSPLRPACLRDKRFHIDAYLIGGFDIRPLRVVIV